MEPDQNLNNPLLDLLNDSNADLHNVLHNESAPLLLDTLPNSEINDNASDQLQNSNDDMMQFCREPWTSQVTSQINCLWQTQSLASKLNTPLTLRPGDDDESNSVILKTQEIEQIILNDSELALSSAPSKAPNPSKSTDLMEFLPAGIQEEYLNLSSVAGSQKTNSFERDMRIYNDTDFNFPPFEMNFEELFALERIDNNANVKSYSGTVKESKREKQHNVSSSCPIPMRASKSSSSADKTILNSSAGSAQNNPVNFVTIEYSQNESDCYRANTTNPKSLLNENISTADTTMVPSAVKQLYDVIKANYSDFAFVYALSAQLCQERVPMDCFVTLKMGLLLSLASIGPNTDRPPIPIIVIGTDTYMANYLLSEVGQLATRFVDHTEDVRPPTNSTTNRNRKWLEADPIILAKGGVYYVGDWSHLKLPRADKLFKIIECSRVPVEQSIISYPLDTAIWSHWRSFKHSSKDQQIFNKLIKIFGLPIFMDDSNHEVLVDFIFEQSSVNAFESTTDHLSISAADMRSFLAAIALRTVDLTDDASRLLQQYFVASRVERPDCLTKQGFVVLKQFAESFAKLAFRHEVLTIDVLSAIYMCEHFLQNIFGASANPPPPFKSHNFIGLVDSHLANFQQWLESYIEQYCKKD